MHQNYTKFKQQKVPKKAFKYATNFCDIRGIRDFRDIRSISDIRDYSRYSWLFADRREYYN